MAYQEEQSAVIGQIAYNGFKGSEYEAENVDIEAELERATRKIKHIKNMTVEGFEGSRYNRHDEMIVSIVDEINADKAGTIGTTEEQAAGIADIDPRLVKVWMIQETGGNGAKSKLYWEIDPLQVNRDTEDWTEYKSDLGLKKSEVRAGDLKTNIRAGIIFMIRKGFGESGQPPQNRTEGFYDGVEVALERYNGVTAETTNGQMYRQNYSDRIMQRYHDAGDKIAISLPRKVED